jgi:hypothetical protein
MHTLYNLLLLVSMYSLMWLVTSFRYAWRPDTKVFPYQAFPE